MNKQIVEMAKISNDILIQVKPVKLRQKITLDIYELIGQTRKETAREILQEVRQFACDELGCILSGVNFTNKLAEKYGVEV